MNSKALFAIVAFVMVIVNSSTALPQNSNVLLGTQPTNMYFNNQMLVVYLKDTPKPLIFGYNGNGFPSGTQTRYKMVTINDYKQWTIEYMVPGDVWRTLTWDMLKCKDANGDQCPTTQPMPPQYQPRPTEPKPEPPKPEPKPEPPKQVKEEKFQCEFPVLGPLAIGAAATALPDKVKASTSNTKAEVNLGSDLIQFVGGALIGAGLECGWDYLAWKAEQNKKAQQAKK